MFIRYRKEVEHRAMAFNEAITDAGIEHLLSSQFKLGESIVEGIFTEGYVIPLESFNGSFSVSIDTAHNVIHGNTPKNGESYEAKLESHTVQVINGWVKKMVRSRKIKLTSMY